MTEMETFWVIERRRAEAGYAPEYLCAVARDGAQLWTWTDDIHAAAKWDAESDAQMHIDFASDLEIMKGRVVEHGWMARR